jgi:hypothetical protein
MVKGASRVEKSQGGVRGATYVVAATDATAEEKQNADRVCSGAADDVDIQEFYDACGAGESVCLVGRTFTLASGLTLDTSDVALYHNSEALLTTAADIDAVTISARAIVKNILVTNTGTPTKAGWKFTDGALVGSFENLRSTLFTYAFQFSSTASGGVAYNNFLNCHTSSAGTASLYMSQSGSGWINENRFLGCTFINTGKKVYDNQAHNNNNQYIACSFEGGAQYEFVLYEHGDNVFIAPRVETSVAWGMYVHTATATSDRCVRIFAPAAWLTEYPYFAVMDGMVQIYGLDGFDGLIQEASKANTTVDADSASGQKVLNVTATTNFYKKDTIVIDKGNANEEYHRLASIQDGVSLTMTNNLRYTHTAVDAHTVRSEGLRSGWDRYSATARDFFIYGTKVMQITNAGVTTVLGALTDNTAPPQ